MVSRSYISLVTFYHVSSKINSKRLNLCTPKSPAEKLKLFDWLVNIEILKLTSYLSSQAIGFGTSSTIGVAFEYHPAKIESNTIKIDIIMHICF